MVISKLKRLIVGEPLSTQRLGAERITKTKALAVLSSDALSSVSYATEEILIPLAAFLTAAVAWSMPIALSIGVLLLILTISYRQTIDAYPQGGGAYIVAKENIGVCAGLTAGAALLIDYVLTVAVSIASGVENIASAVPALREHKEAIGILLIFLIMILNLRGVRESATVFSIPTYAFVVSIIVLLLTGSVRLLNGEHAASAPIIHEVYPAIPPILALRAFSSGCSALTGVEAISNGIPMFREPSTRNAKTTMAWMAFLLGGFFLGITLLAHVYGIIPHEGETAVSLLAKSVFGGTGMYYVTIASTAMILVLAANTSYAGFPRLASMLARDRYLPRQLTSLGDRLVFSNGIIGLSVAAMILLVLFGGDTHHLIPLYAVGVFLSFTLSQTGMVRHHLRKRGKHWRKSVIISGLGALTTAIVLTVIAVTKFMTGAWMVVILIPALVFVFTRIHNHYTAMGRELSLSQSEAPARLMPMKHTVIIPISGLHRGVIDALRYAVSISKDVRACYVDLDPAATEKIQRDWQRWAKDVPLVILRSPYRSVLAPLLKYIDDLGETTNGDVVTVVIPEFVTARWWHQFLHNQTALMIRTALLFKPGKVVTSVRYHLRGT